MQALALAIVLVALAGCVSTEISGPVRVEQDCALAYNISACKEERALQAAEREAQEKAAAERRAEAARVAAEEKAARSAYLWAAYKLPAIVGAIAAIACAVLAGVGGWWLRRRNVSPRLDVGWFATVAAAAGWVLGATATTFFTPGNMFTAFLGSVGVLVLLYGSTRLPL